MIQSMEAAGLWPDEDTQEEFEQVALQEAISSHKVSDPDVLADLLRAKSAQRVRRICSDAYVLVGNDRVPNWPLRHGSILPQCLSKYAEAFIAAKASVRFPGKLRPSNELKQLWFLARALAGAAFGIETRTVLNIVGATRPEEILVQARAGKRKRAKSRQELS